MGSLILFLSSELLGNDLLNKIGYKKGIIYGLTISIIGALALAYVTGTNTQSYAFILVTFFIIALGFSLQQTAAQPFAISLGTPETGSHRLNMAGSINSFGTLIGPLVVSILLFGSANSNAIPNIQSIKILYLFLAGLFTLSILIFNFSKLPQTNIPEKTDRSPKALFSLLILTAVLLIIILLAIFSPIHKSCLIVSALLFVFILLISSYRLSQKNPNQWGAMQYPQLVLGMLAIFVYVGVEVSIQSNMGALLKLPEFGGLHESNISSYISLYWGSLMIGRWIGALSVFKLSKTVKNILSFVVPYLAFALYLVVNHIKGNEIANLYPYTICILLLIIASLIAQDKPTKTLLVLSIFGASAMLLGTLISGNIGLYAIISGGLFCSVMWPCIFSLATAGLGKYTGQGSALLIMMILGGAIIPPLQGAMIDIPSIGAQYSYLLPVTCFLFLAYYALLSKKILKNQGIDFDTKVATTH